ncbi:MAG: hypothetical protein R3211_03325 [Balneolaceae bacterium]|nr:hypothetical protein [Balneolaceae bacterium]
MKVKTMVGALIFLIVLNIGLLGTIVYLHVADRQPPIARFLDPKPTFDPPFTQQFEGVEELTTEQRQKLQSLLKSYRSEIEPLQEKVRALEQKMFNSLIENDSTHFDEIQDIMRSLAEVRLKMGEHALESLQKAKSFLSEKQQRIFIRQIMSAGRGPGPNGSTPPLRRNRPVDNQ